MSQQVDPSHIMQVGMGFWASKTLLSAVELELFTRLGSDSATGGQIAETLALDERAIPDYIGGILEMANARLYPFWGDLTEALQTGKPQNEIKRTGTAMFEELYS